MASDDEDSFFNNLFLSPTIRSPLYKFLKLVKEKWTEEENLKREKERLNYQNELKEWYENELQKVKLGHGANLKKLQDSLCKKDAHIQDLTNRLRECNQKIKEQKKELNKCHSRSTHIDRVSHQVNQDRQKQSQHKEQQEKHQDISCFQGRDNKCSAIRHIEPKVPSQEQHSHSPSTDTLEPLIHKRKRSSSVGSRKFYGVIRAGNITHEDIQSRFTTYFTKYRRQYGSQLVANHGITQSMPCIIMQLAFDKCKEILLEKMKSRLLNQDNHEVIKAMQLLNQCADEAPVKERFSNHFDELNVLFKEPEKKTDELKFWDERKCAFALLLSCINIDDKNVHRTVKCHILQVLLKMKNIKYPNEMAEEAATIALDMITLVPPAIVCQPKQYQDEWQDKRTTYWKEDPQILLIYFRPVLFFSAIGHIGCKGEVGNTIPKDKEMQCIQDTSQTHQVYYTCPPFPNERSKEATHPAGTPNLKLSTGTSHSKPIYQNEELRKSFSLPDKHTLKTCSRCSDMAICQTHEGQYICENCKEIFRTQYS